MISKPSFVETMKTGLIAGITAAIVNLVVWGIGQITAGMVLPVILAGAFSIIGVLIGGLIYFGLSRFLGARTNLVFTILSVIFL